LTIGDLRTVDEATRHGLPSAAKGRNQMNLCGRVIQTRQITMWHKPDGSGEPSAQIQKTWWTGSNASKSFSQIRDNP